MSRTKIVATYGPACEPERTFKAMLRAGLDVVRLNVSHLDPERIGPTVGRLRRFAREEKLPLAVLADMPGPKVRCTECEPDKFQLSEGDRIDLSARNAKSTPREICIRYPRLLDDVRKGHQLAINDGLVLLEVVKVDPKAGTLRARVLAGGEVSSRKGVSFLHSTLRVPSITPRDRRGLRAAAEAQVDFIALSFVRSEKDMHQARRILGGYGAEDIPLVAKIEQHEAVDRIDAIVGASDAIMVARGDMGIERPLEQVPLLQKDIIAVCNRSGKAVITATQMLESMIENTRPTRAEVSDVANAILDGTDAVMLSAETATGRNPVRTVRTMTQIALAAETRIDQRRILEIEYPLTRRADLDDALAHAACELAYDTPLDALVCLSFYGTTARRVARYRPECPIYVLSPYEAQCRRLALTWGVEVFPFAKARPSRSGKTRDPEHLIAPMIEALRSFGRLRPGQRVAFLAGIPLDRPGGTNWLRVVEVE
ncbi:pyruvate kinase [Candidatus Sumerlaeota bacterium]|nr:pyruvate kinase [Candidatus Sumerlaeota bacterium]